MGTCFFCLPWQWVLCFVLALPDCHVAYFSPLPESVSCGMFFSGMFFFTSTFQCCQYPSIQMFFFNGKCHPKRRLGTHGCQVGASCLCPPLPPGSGQVSPIQPPRVQACSGYFFFVACCRLGPRAWAGFPLTNGGGALPGARGDTYNRKHPPHEHREKLGCPGGQGSGA
jgi:hypothetical protein